MDKKNVAAHEAAMKDAIIHGTGMYIQNPDGTQEHVPYGATIVTDPAYIADQEARNKRARAMLDQIASRASADVSGLTRYGVNMDAEGWKMVPGHEGGYYACRDVEQLFAASNAPKQPEANLSDSIVQKGVAALLQCSASDLESVSAKLMAAYEADVTRVYAAMSAAPAAPLPEHPQQPVIWFDANATMEDIGELVDARMVKITGSTAKFGEFTTPLYAAAAAPAPEQRFSMQIMQPHMDVSEQTAQPLGADGVAS